MGVVEWIPVMGITVFSCSVSLSLCFIKRNREIFTIHSSELPLKANYHIYSAIRRGFHLSRMTTNNLISSM